MRLNLTVFHLMSNYFTVFGTCTRIMALFSLICIVLARAHMLDPTPHHASYFETHLYPLHQHHGENTSLNVSIDGWLIEMQSILQGPGVIHVHHMHNNGTVHSVPFLNWTEIRVQRLDHLQPQGHRRRLVIGNAAVNQMRQIGVRHRGCMRCTMPCN